MNIANIEVSGLQAIAGNHALIPAGIVGATVTFDFTDPRWEDLTKIAVFQGCVTRDVTMTGNVVVIPHETVAQVDCTLRVGIYGVDAQRNLVIPTLWATVGMTLEGTDPSGDEALDPTPSVWEQIAQRMTELEEHVSNVDGLSMAAKQCLIAVLQDGLFTADQSANIRTLAAELGISVQ